MNASTLVIVVKTARDARLLERKVLDVHIDIGMRDGQQIRFSAEGDQEPGIEPGDIIVVLDEQKHPVFKRRGNDLFIDFELDLVDALCGFQKTIETLDKRTLVITSLPGEVIRPGDVRCILNEGMPQHRDPFNKGRLVICFAVKFPHENWISPDKYVALEQLLPPRREVLVPDAHEGVVMHKFDPSSASASASHRRRPEAYDSDEEEMGMGGQQFQCASH